MKILQFIKKSLRFIRSTKRNILLRSANITKTLLDILSSSSRWQRSLLTIVRMKLRLKRKSENYDHNLCQQLQEFLMNWEHEYETVWDCYTHKYAAGDFKAPSYASRHTRDAHIATTKCTIKYSPRTEMPFGFVAFFTTLFNIWLSLVYAARVSWEVDKILHFQKI